MNADHESARLEAVDLQPVEGMPYLQAYLEAYLEPYLETCLKARPGPEDGGTGDLRPDAGEPVDRRLDDEEAPEQELMDREPYLQAYLEPYLEACLEPAELPAVDPEPAEAEPAGPEPPDAQPVNLRASDLEAVGPEAAPRPTDAESDEPAPDLGPADLPPTGPEADPEPVDQEQDELRAAQVRRRAEAERLATSIRWMPPAPARQPWTPLASASLVAGQVRLQLVPCLRALRSVGLDGCAYQLQRLDHVLERIATVPEAPVAYGPDM